MKKRGISAVISTVLIVALVLAISIIVWLGVSNIVEKESKEISFGKVSLDLEIVNVYPEEGKLVINVQREKGKGDLLGIKFIIEGGDLKEVFENQSSMREFDSAKFIFSLEEIVPGEVTKVSVAPVLSSGVEEIRDVWEQ